MSRLSSRFDDRSLVNPSTTSLLTITLKLVHRPFTFVFFCIPYSISVLVMCVLQYLLFYTPPSVVFTWVSKLQSTNPLTTIIVISKHRVFKCSNPEGVSYAPTIKSLTYNYVPWRYDVKCNVNLYVLVVLLVKYLDLLTT